MGVSSVADMQFMYAGATKFNGDVSDWDVSSVGDMESMFDGATKFNGDVSDWDVSSVGDMYFMFGGASEFNGDISDWDVSSVTNMRWMFDDATKFNCDVSDWDVSSVRVMECSSSSCCPGRAFCNGVRNNFKAFGGDCSQYSDYYCDTDIDETSTYFAKDVCSECGECVDPLVANTSPPTVSSDGSRSRYV